MKGKQGSVRAEQDAEVAYRVQELQNVDVLRVGLDETETADAYWAWCVDQAMFRAMPVLFLTPERCIIDVG